MPFFRCFCVDKSITPYFRRISSPTISKSPPNGVPRAMGAEVCVNRIASDAAQGRQDRRDRDET